MLYLTAAKADKTRGQPLPSYLRMKGTQFLRAGFASLSTSLQDLCPARSPLGAHTQHALTQHTRARKHSPPAARIATYRSTGRLVGRRHTRRRPNSHCAVACTPYQRQRHPCGRAIYVPISLLYVWHRRQQQWRSDQSCSSRLLSRPTPCPSTHRRLLRCSTLPAQQVVLLERPSW